MEVSNLVLLERSSRDASDGMRQENCSAMLCRERATVWAMYMNLYLGFR